MGDARRASLGPLVRGRGLISGRGTDFHDNDREGDLREWLAPPVPLEPISDLIGSIGTLRFAERLLALLKCLIPVDHCSVQLRIGNNQAKILLSAGPDGSSGDETLLRQHHGQDLVMDDTISGEWVCIRLTRHFEDRFDSADVSIVESYAPLIMSALRQHLTLAPAKETVATPGTMSSKRRQDLLAQIRSDLLRLCSISPREAEVCAHIAIGYNINAISMLLGISQNTASTHRKRAYAKLGISSQNELFARYIAFVPGRVRAPEVPDRQPYAAACS